MFRVQTLSSEGNPGSYSAEHEFHTLPLGTSKFKISTQLIILSHVCMLILYYIICTAVSQIQNNSTMVLGAVVGVAVMLLIVVAVLLLRKRLVALYIHIWRLCHLDKYYLQTFRLCVYAPQTWKIKDIVLWRLIKGLSGKGCPVIEYSLVFSSCDRPVISINPVCVVFSLTGLCLCFTGGWALVAEEALRIPIFPQVTETIEPKIY